MKRLLALSVALLTLSGCAAGPRPVDRQTFVGKPLAVMEEHFGPSGYFISGRSDLRYWGFKSTSYGGGISTYYGFIGNTPVTLHGPGEVYEVTRCCGIVAYLDKDGVVMKVSNTKDEGCKDLLI